MTGVQRMITLDPDVYAEVERLRHESDLDENGAVNALARRGMAAPELPRPYEPPPARDLGEARMDLSCIGAALTALDEEEWRR